VISYVGFFAVRESSCVGFTSCVGFFYVCEAIALDAIEMTGESHPIFLGTHVHNQYYLLMVLKILSIEVVNPGHGFISIFNPIIAA